MNPKTLSLLLISTLLNFAPASASIRESFLRDSPDEGMTDPADEVTPLSGSSGKGTKRGRNFENLDEDVGLIDEDPTFLPVSVPQFVPTPAIQTFSDDVQFRSNKAPRIEESSPSHRPAFYPQSQEFIPISTTQPAQQTTDLGAEVFGAFYRNKSGLYLGPAYHGLAPQGAVEAFWEKVKEQKFKAATLIAQSYPLEISPVNPFAVEMFAEILRNWGYGSDKTFEYLYDNFRDLVTLKASRHDNIYVNANQWAIDDLSAHYSENDLINDRLLEACILNEHLRLPIDFYRLHPGTENGILRNIMIALLTSKKPSEALYRAIQVPESLDFFYEDGESVLDKAIRLNHVAGFTAILARDDSVDLVLRESTRGITPFKLLADRQSASGWAEMVQGFFDLLEGINECQEQSDFEHKVFLFNQYINGARGYPNLLELIQGKIMDFIEDLSVAPPPTSVLALILANYIRLYDAAASAGAPFNPQFEARISAIRDYSNEFEDDGAMSEQEDENSMSEEEDEDENSMYEEEEDENDDDNANAMAEDENDSNYHENATDDESASSEFPSIAGDNEVNTTVNHQQQQQQNPLDSFNLWENFM